MNKIGYLNPKYTIVITGLLILFWAFGSYFIYTITYENAKVCFPPIDGCEYISHSANYHISSIFYRATILPTTVLLSLSSYFILQYAKSYLGIKKATYTILFLIAVIIAPIALNITEALPNGTAHYGFKKIHNIFAGAAFGTIIIFELTISIISFKKIKNTFTIAMLLISIVEIILLIIPELMPTHQTRVICQWNLMISNALWFVLFGLGIDAMFKGRR